jgi:antirestriction protein ArdC
VAASALSRKGESYESLRDHHQYYSNKTGRRVNPLAETMEHSRINAQEPSFKKRIPGDKCFYPWLSALQFTYWLTFKQCKDLGGNIRKGAQGTPVVYWNWQEIEEDGETEKKVPFMRYYTVFNVAQCENIPEDKIPATTEATTTHIDKIMQCEGIVENWEDKPEIRHGEQKAYYRPSSDLVNMPQVETFMNSEEYYSTLFHELTHSTGHEKRLNRQGITEIAPFGTPLYSKEELVAEMGAAFLCGYTGIEYATIDNSAAYIQGWLGKLKNEKKLVILAAAQAQKAANYILNI